MSNVPIRDVSLFVKLVGQGYPLLLMHGGPGLDHTTLLSLRPLADQFTLVFYDHRCNGRSDGAVASMTWENLTADADALRRTLGFDDWAVLGHSFGGNVALEYALRYPEHLSRLILLDTCGEFSWYSQNAPLVLGRRGYNPATVAAARRFFNGDITPAEVIPIARKFARAYYHRFGLSAMLDAIALAFRMKMRPEATVFGFSQLLKGWTVMDHLHDIDVPTLVVAGRDDFLFPPEHQAILADRLPNAELEIIERAGHEAPNERPAEVIASIRDFLTVTEPTVVSPALAAAL